MTKCIFWSEKHAVLNDDHKMEILPSKRCTNGQFRGDLFCRYHIKITKNFMPSRIYEFAAKSMREDLAKKRKRK